MDLMDFFIHGNDIPRLPRPVLGAEFPFSSLPSVVMPHLQILYVVESADIDHVAALRKSASISDVEMLLDNGLINESVHDGYYVNIT